MQQTTDRTRKGSPILTLTQFRWILIVYFVSILPGFSASANTIDAPVLTAPQVDGFIKPDEWRDASVDSGLIQIEPMKGQACSEKTRIRVGMDKDHLYIAFECLTRDGTTISGGNPKRDQLALGSDDAVIVVLDTYRDKRSAYVFHLNPLNTQTDMRVESDGSSEDVHWDATWQSAVSRNESGWFAEVAIPFKSLRYSSKNKQWGVNFGRVLARNQEVAWWSGELDDNFRISQSGVLLLEKSPGFRKPILLIPYVTERYDHTIQSRQTKEWQTEVGLDAEIPVSTELSLNATINPDFASVEGDQEQINLDLWEIQYPEKRPFFRDVGALFDTRIKVFYSRRIGDIRHGEKISGKVGDYQIAGVYARTQPQSAGGELLQPGAHFTAVKVQRDILTSSTVGLTLVDKSRADAYHRVLSMDTKMRLPHQIYLTAQFAASWPGSFWDHAGGFLRIAREDNIYHYHIRYTAFGKDFMDNINAVGYLSYDDVQEVDADFNYKFWLRKTPVKLINYQSKNRLDWDVSGSLWRYDFSQVVNIYLHNRLSLMNRARTEYRLRNGKDSYYRSMRSVLGYNVLEWSHAIAGLEKGDSFTHPFTLYEAGMRFKLSRVLSLSYSLNRLQFDPDPESESTDIHVLVSDIYATPDLFLRVFTQYRSSTNRFYFYGKFGFRFRPPDSAIYLTTTYDIEDPEMQEMIRTPKNRIVFLKVSHAFSL